MKKRFARHNRVKRQSAAGTSGVVAAVRSGNIAVATSQPLASRLDDVQVVEPSLDDDDTAPMPGSSRDKRIVAVQAPGSVAVASHGSLSADASSAPVAASTVSQVVADAGLSDAVVEPPVKKLKTQAEVVQHVQSIDTRENRISVAAQHDLLWTTAPGDGRYQKCFGHVVQCLLCRDRRQSQAEAKKKLVANALCMFVERVEETYVGTMRLGCVASRNAPEALL